MTGVVIEHTYYILLYGRIGRRLRGGVRSTVEPAIPKILCPPGMN
jgi:hypothetical protein